MRKGELSVKAAKQVEIVVDGVTGVGKSSMVKILCEEFNLQPFNEMFEDENRLLNKFFHDRAKWAFPMQINFLTNRFKQYRQAMKVGQAVMDRSIYSDSIFARMYLEYGYLKPEEYAVYNNLLNTMLDNVLPPKLLIYLRVTTDEAVRRINKRGRPDEVEVEWEYWNNLNRFYEENYAGFSQNHLLVLQVDEFDYVHRPQDRSYVVQQVKQAWKNAAEKRLSL